MIDGNDIVSRQQVVQFAVVSVTVLSLVAAEERAVVSEVGERADASPPASVRCESVWPPGVSCGNTDLLKIACPALLVTGPAVFTFCQTIRLG